MRIVIALLVWVAAIAGAAELSSAVASSIHHHRTATTATAAGSAGAATTTAAAVPFDPASVHAADRRSLLRTPNLARALATARRHLGPSVRISDAALYPGYLSLIVLVRGQQTSATVDAVGGWHATSAGAASGSATFGAAALRPAIISTLLGRIESGAHVSLAAIGYVAVVAADGHLIYGVYEKDRRTSFRASSAHGPIEVVQGSRVHALR